MIITKWAVSAVAVALAAVSLWLSLRLLMLHRSITTYKHYWDGQAARTDVSGSLLYVALGDSTAQGIGASRPEKGYVGLIAQQLSVQTGRPVHVINLSTSGATLRQLIDEQLPKLIRLNLPPDAVVTLAIGANDLNNFEAGSFMSQTDVLLARLPAQTIVADIPYFGGGRKKHQETDATVASGIITKTAQLYNLRVAPLHQITKDNDNFQVYGADFFHPSNTGYKNWHKAFAEALKQ